MLITLDESVDKIEREGGSILQQWIVRDGVGILLFARSGMD